MWLPCAADWLKPCRKSVDILVSSLTIVRVRLPPLFISFKIEA